MDHPAWLPPYPAAQRSQSNFRAFCSCFTILGLTFTLPPPTPSLYRFCRLLSNNHIPYVWAVPTACFSVTALFFSCLETWWCLLLDVLSLLLLKELLCQVFVITTSPLRKLYSCCPCKAVSPMAAPPHYWVRAPTRCLGTERPKKSRTVSVLSLPDTGWVQEDTGRKHIQTTGA